MTNIHLPQSLLDRNFKHSPSWVSLQPKDTSSNNKIVILSGIIFSILFCSISFTASSQSVYTANTIAADSILIKNIFISGNKKTKPYVIIREMLIQQGNKVATKDLNTLLQQSRQMIFNTSLFVDDSVYITRQTIQEADIAVVVKERWYFFPLPYFKLVDRNFNQWWVDQHRSLDRVNYGIKFIHNNISGQNDKLNVWLIAGYSQQFLVRYELPFFDKAHTKGINIGFGVARQHEMNFQTSDSNKQEFYRLENNFSRTILRSDISYTYRPGRYLRHNFKVSYIKETIADSVLLLNPKYFPENRTSIEFVDFNYSVNYTKTDYNEYPTKGIIASAGLYKRGLNSLTNLWQTSVHGIYAVPLSAKTYAHAELAATIKFPYNPYFISQTLFGYGDFKMRGLEYNVVDGMAGILGKFTLGTEIYSFIFKNPFKSKTHDKIPFKFYAKIYSDLGYAYNPYNTTNLLNNKLLRSWGLGIDIVSIYDFVFRIEYSFNQIGRQGLYLHSKD